MILAAITFTTFQLIVTIAAILLVIGFAVFATKMCHEDMHGIGHAWTFIIGIGILVAIGFGTFIFYLGRWTAG